MIFELPSGELNGPHTQTIWHFVHKELRKPTEIETCFFRTIWVPFQFPVWETMVFVASLISSLLQKNESMICVSFPTGNVWQHYGSPWGTGGGDISLKTIGIFFYACKASNHEVFSGLGDGWGGVPSSGFFEGLDGLETLRQKDGMISKGDLNFQGDKMISYWKEKHQKIILLMIFEALCSVFVILWNDFWSFSSVMFFFDIDTINVSRNLDMRCQKFPHRPGSISLATIAPGRNGLMQRLRIQKLYWKMNTLLGHWSNKLAVTNPL